MFPLLSQSVLLRYVRHLVTYTFPISKYQIQSQKYWVVAQMLSCVHFRLPNTSRPMHTQELTEVILPPIQNFMMVRT
jgi:hypothetical protein